MRLQATAAAVVLCTSTDKNAFLCDSVTASAAAYAATTVKAHTSAVASALRGCGCNSKAEAFGTSEAFFDLVAEAEVEATASACISGAQLELAPPPYHVHVAAVDHTKMAPADCS